MVIERLLRRDIVNNVMVLLLGLFEESVLWRIDKDGVFFIMVVRICGNVFVLFI